MRYQVWINKDVWGKDDPLILDWSYELIGDIMREKFDKYYESILKDQKIVKGGSRQGPMRAETLKGWMTRQTDEEGNRINIVDDEARGTLTSKFILKVGKKMLIDERAKIDLERRFGDWEVVDEEGEKETRKGVLSFKEMGKSKKKEEKTVKIKGTGLDYFPEDKPIPVKDVECEYCGKKFFNKKQLRGHQLTCKPKKDGDKSK